MNRWLRKTLWEGQLRARGKGRRFDYARQFAEWQWLPAGELVTLQQQRLHSLLAHAAVHVPYYQAILRRTGVVDRSGRVNLELFNELPLLDKTILRERFEDLRSDDLSQRRWKYNTSGGSTGETAEFIQDQEYQESTNAFKILADSWTGYDLGLPKVMIWGSERDLRVGQETLRVRLGRWLENTTCLNAFRMGPEQMKQFVECINRIRPVQILTYVESIYELARFVEAGDLEVHSPRAIVTTAGTLHPPMREVIERVFRAPVFNWYGSREVSVIANECERHEGLHVSALTVYLEILRPDGSPSEPGEVGEVVVTSLTNYAMPLVRYRAGDMTAWAEESCSCGRNWPLLKTVSGRVRDVCVTADGTLVDGAIFYRMFFFRKWVRKYQVVQDRYDHILIRVVPVNENEKTFDIHRAEVREIEETVRLAMGPTCQVAWELLSDITPTASGKYRFIISNVPR